MSGLSSWWTTVALVAGREIRIRATSKAFLWTTGLLVAAIVAGGLVLSALEPDVLRPDVVGVPTSSTGLGPAVEAAGAAVGAPLEVRHLEGDGVAELTAGEVDAVLEASGPTLTATVLTGVPFTLEPVLSVLAQQLELADQIARLGGDPAQVVGAVAEAQPRVVSLEEVPAVDDDVVGGGQALTGVLSGVLIFIAIIMSGQLVAVGVVEEKTSRVVELLLATIRPAELMAGKVLGIGVIGLIQLAAVLIAGAGTALATGVVDGTGVDVGATVVWVVVWFLLGYAMYSLLLGGLGALVSRQEDVQTVVTPVIVMATIPYLIGVTVAPTEPSSPLVQWLSLVPFFAPFLMPIRISVGGVAPWEMALALVLAVLTIPVLVWLAGRIYRNAVLRTGARVPLREALRGA
jgi:ABC-2 type transport system permease protein